MVGHSENASERIFLEIGPVMSPSRPTTPSWVHRFGALRSKALAGNIHDAIALGEESLARPDVPAPLRQRLSEYVELLRIRRAQWSADLTLATRGEHKGDASIS